MKYQDTMEELKGAMKAGDTAKRDVIRLLQSALKNYAIDARTPVEELGDSDVEMVIKKLVKQRKDSIAQYQAGGREDLVAQEQSELDLLSVYLPKEMEDDELVRLVDEVLSEGGFTTKADIGKATGMVMKKANGSVSGDRVRDMLASRLTA